MPGPTSQQFLRRELQGVQVFDRADLAGQDGIPPGPRLGEGFRAERFADALLGDGRGVHHVMDEPGAVVVPEMVVWIGRIKPNG